MQLLPVAVREPLFADRTFKQVGGHAGYTPIAAVLTGWLHPDCSHPLSPPLLVFAFVLFDKRQQFFISLTRMHAVKPPALAPRFKRGNLPQAPYFREFLFAEPAFDNEKSVDMPKQGMVIVNGGDKRDAVTKLCFDLLERFAGEFP